MTLAREFQRDYTFDEWQQLPFEIQRDIWNHYWNPYEPDIGKSTKDAIVTAFRSSHVSISNAAIDIGCGFFGLYVACLYVIVTDGAIKVPRKFASLLVNKGVLRDRIDDHTLLVDWRDVGGAKCRYTLDPAKQD